MQHTVGFIGLGLMGYAIAERFLKAGNPIFVFDLSTASMDRLVAQGATPASSPQDLADKASVVISCLPSPSASEEVALGNAGVLHGKRIRIYVETSTIGVGTCKAIATKLAEQTIRMVDAPVSGGPRAVAQGKLTSMVATDPATWLEIENIIKDYSGTTFLVGSEPGLAQACKLVNNAMSLATLALACETAVFGVAAGLDAKTMIDVINVSSGRSAATMDKFPTSILTGTFDYGASVRTAAKDMALFIQEAKALGMDVQGTSSLADVWSNAAATGDPERDFTTLIQQFETPLQVAVRSKEPTA